MSLACRRAQLLEGWDHLLPSLPINFPLGVGNEEQFYLVFGVLLLVSRRYVFVLAAALSAVVFAIAPLSPEGFFFDGRWLLFAAGIGVYYSAIYASRAETAVIVLAIVAALSWSHLRPPHHEAFHTNYLAGYGFALLLMALRPLDERISDWRLLAPLTLCGAMCYSIYLVHWPLVKLVGMGCRKLGLESDAETVLVVMPACIAASVAVGWGFHLLVERRFLNTPATAKPPVAASIEIVDNPNQLSLSSS